MSTQPCEHKWIFVLLAIDLLDPDDCGGRCAKCGVAKHVVEREQAEEQER